MPVLFYGGGKRSLYGVHHQRLDKDVFREFRIKGLCKKETRFAIGILWHLTELSHTAIAWRDQAGLEQVVFLPGFLTHKDALLSARAEFGHWIPSSTVFRFKNERKVKRG